MLFWWRNLIAALSRKKYYYDDEEDTIEQAAKSRRSQETKLGAPSLGSIDESEEFPNTQSPSETPTGGLNNLGEKFQGQSTSDDDKPSGDNRNYGSASSSVQNHDVGASSGKDQKLARVLGLVDLTMLGVGATLGVGVYVLAGSVARNEAGPSVVVSFAIAAVASLFSGFCYSEFASRISKSGSAYNYTYLSIGEFAAYIIGWNLVLEYIIGTACEAKAIANQIDSLLGNAYQETMTRWLPIRSSFLASYPDFMAPVFVLLITGLLSWGARESAKVNNVLTFVNLGTVGIIVFSGMFRLNPRNWSIPKSDIPAGVRAGSGGFAPFGLTGIVTGAAKCFFGFVGFDGIATTGEETHNPKRNIPLAIILSLLIVFVCYFSIALVITMIVPYYEQNAEAPFPAIFDRLGWPMMKWTVTIGSLVALFTAMFGAFFPLPRILFAMSRDGLLYKPFSYVSPRTQTPLISTAISGLLTAVMSAVFKLDQLVDMMSIGTLLAYIIVAVCVLLLRYSDDDLEDDAQEGLVSPEPDFFIGTLENSYKDNMDHPSFPCADPCTNKPVINGLPNVKQIKSSNNTLHGNSDPTKPNLNHLTSSIRKIDSSIANVKETDPGSWLNDNMAIEFQSGSITNRSAKSIGQNRTFSKQRTETVEGLNAIFYNVDILDSSSDFEHLKPNLSRNPSVTCPSKFTRLVRVLFNTQNHTKVTRSSQSVSKCCIHFLVILTIASSFLLNSATRENEGADLSLTTPLKYESMNASQSIQPVNNKSRPLEQVNFLPEKSNTDFSLFTNAQSPLNIHPSNDRRSKSTEAIGENAVSQNQTSYFSSEDNLFDENSQLRVDERHSGKTTLGELFHNYFFQSRSLVHLKESASSNSSASHTFRYTLYASVGVSYLTAFLVLARQGQNKSRLNFKVPFVPLVPCVSIFMNVYLMINLDVSTWVRFLVWLVLGMAVYFSYGIFHSKQKIK